MAIDFDGLVLGPTMRIFGGREEITYYPASGSPVTLTDAVFEDAHVSVSFDGDGAQVNTVTPALGVRRAHFAADPAQHDHVMVEGKGYFHVVDPQPDGQGHVLLILQLAEPA